MSDYFLQELRAQKFYAGQIYRLADMEGKKAKAITCSSFLEKLGPETEDSFVNADLLGKIFTAAGLSELYAHQQRVAERILQLQNTVIASAVGSGRSTIADIMGIYRVLGFADNILVITPDPFTAKRRTESLKNTISRLGFDYAIEVASLEDTLLKDTVLPEIVVTTPPHLAKMFERKYDNVLDPGFFGCARLIIAEDIHEYTGIYGGNVAALLRCLRVLFRRQSNESAVLATSVPFKNVLSFAGKLFDRDMAGSLVLEDGAESTRKKLIFWNAPLVRGGDTDQEFKRKDFSEDTAQLLEFLSRYGLQESTASGRRFCFLIDKSGSMSGDKFQSVVSAITKDIRHKVNEGFFIEGDFLEFFLFDTNTIGPLCDTQVDSSKDIDIETIVHTLQKEEPSGGTDIAGALKTVLEGEKNMFTTGSPSRLVLFIYSDGEDSIAQDKASEIRMLAEQIRRTLNVPLDILYVSLGIAPDPSVRSLVVMLGGKLLVTGQDTEGSIPSPSDLWQTSSITDRPVVVLSFNDVFSLEEIATLDCGPRPVLLRPKISHPGLSHGFSVAEKIYNRVANEHDLATSQFLVITGWNGSPSLLRHYLEHIGLNDSYVFILGMAEPLSQFNLRKWEQLIDEPVNDCLSLNPHSTSISAKTVRYFCRYNQLSASEASYIIFGTWDCDTEKVKAALFNAPDIIVATNNDIVPKQEESRQFDLWESFHVVDEPVMLKVVGPDNKGFPIDNTGFLRNMVPGGTMTINGARYGINLKTDNMIELSGTTSHSWSCPHIEITVKPGGLSEGHPTQHPFLGAPHVSREKINVVATLKGAKDFSGGRFDLGATSREFPTPLTIAFETEAIVLRYPDRNLTNNLKVSLENLCWTFLSGLVKGEDQACICIAEDAENTLFLFDLIPQGGGLAASLEENNFSLLISGMKYAFFSLMGCPCEEDASLAAKHTSSVVGGSVDSGCHFCLHAPTKPAGFADINGKKREVIEFIAASSVVEGEGWRERLTEKYEKVEDENRFYSARGKYDSGYVPQVRRILSDKLGVEFEDGQIAKARYATSQEYAANASASGWYSPDKNEVVIRPYPNEFTLLDIFGHEYAHNWQHFFCSDSYPITKPYNFENVEDESNVPFLGLLFIEGSAVWIEAQVMDYFANRSVLREENLRIGNEYWQGFKAVKYVEEKCGMKLVFSFLTAGVLPDPPISSLSNLYQDSGVAGFILRTGRHLIDSGELACLGERYLRQPKDIIRISAYLKDVPIPSLPEAKEIQQLGDDLIKEIIKNLSLHTAIDKFPSIKKTIEGLDMKGLLDNEKASNMSVKIACHLHSNAQRPTSSLLTPLVEDIFQEIKSSS